MGRKAKIERDEIEPTTKIRNGKKQIKKENALDIISMSVKKLYEENGKSIDEIYSKIFGLIIGYSMGSKSKTKIMKSYEINKREVETNLKKQKKENALDIISKSLQKINNDKIIYSFTNN